jgi:two-component system, NarL family, sensor histidine kinase LiaS
LDRVRRRACGLSGRLIASYVLVTLAVVVLVEALVLGYQAPRLENDTRLEDQVGATAKLYLQQLWQRYPDAVPPGTLLGDGDQPVRPGQVRPDRDGVTLIIPAVTGPLRDPRAMTAAVLIAPGGAIIASSAPSRYPTGQPAAARLPAAAAAAIAAGHPADVGTGGSGAAPDGRVSWALLGRAGPDETGFVAYLYVQAPSPSTGFVNPIRAWEELRRLAGTGPLLSASYALLIVIVPVGVLFGLLASRRLVRRVRRLERATVAVADGDYTIALPTSGRDEIGRLEANFTTMTGQLGSALAAERERATSDAAAAERARIAREIHDAISQHLFGLRMIAAGMRRDIPDHPQVRAIERITEDALRDMQTLLVELRPASPGGAGLTQVLREICTTYRDRLGVRVDADLGEVTVSAPVEHALLRITQEAFTNAVRHGNARRLAVCTARRNGQVELTISDTGTGFDPSAPRTGSGLSHIHDRVTELGGTVEIDSAPGRGTTLAVRVPAR